MMVEHDIHHLPVTDGGALVGVISGREVALGAAIAEVRDASQEPRVREVVRAARLRRSRTPSRSTACSRRMAREALGSALVTRRGKLVGVFTSPTPAS